MINKPEKVIILGTAWPFRGGLASYNERLAKEFNDLGHECEIVTFTTQYPNILFPGKTQYSEEPAGETKIVRKLNSVNPASWVTTARYINRQQPDLLIVKFWLPFMGPAFGTVLRLLSKDIKKVAILDNVVPHEKRIGDKPFTNYFLQPVQAFVAMSKSVMNDLRQFTETKPCLLNPHPVFDNFGEKIERNKAKTELDLPLEKEYVLFFGFIRKYKGLDLALKAFAVWKKKCPQAVLLVAGEFYDNRDDYINLSKSLMIEEDVVWRTDFIEDSFVKYYFSAASLVLQPYHHATQSGVTQIAYHFEIPMVVTRVGGLPELVENGKTGFLVEKDPEEIAEKVEAFFQKPSDYLHKNMIAAKKRFSWQTMVENIQSLYRDIEQ